MPAERSTDDRNRTSGDPQPGLVMWDEANEILITQRTGFEWMAAEAA